MRNKLCHSVLLEMNLLQLHLCLGECTVCFFFPPFTRCMFLSGPGHLQVMSPHYHLLHLCGHPFFSLPDRQLHLNLSKLWSTCEFPSGWTTHTAAQQPSALLLWIAITAIRAVISDTVNYIMIRHFNVVSVTTVYFKLNVLECRAWRIKLHHHSNTYSMDYIYIHICTGKKQCHI